MKVTKEQIIAWLIGIGLVISVINQPNQLLIEYIFLPQIGSLLIIIVSAFFLLSLKREEISFGSKWLWIPLVIIVGLIVARPFYALATGDTTWGMKIEWSNAAYGMALFALYLASRKLGAEIFKPFTFGVIIASVSMLFGHGIRSGGIISPTNYDMATGFLLFGVLVSSLQSRWWLSAIAIVGLFLTGADEALFAVSILIVVILLRKDWNWRLLVPVATLALTLAICTPLGVTERLWSPSVGKLALAKEAVEDTKVGEAASKIPPIKMVASQLNKVVEARDLATRENISKDELLDRATNNRWLTTWRLSPIKPLGYGYNINNFYWGIPHNVPLIIIEQIGILGALAWGFALLYLLIKTRWRYAWIGFAALGVFDHFTWTMAAPWFWALAGVSSSSTINSDLIFRRNDL